MIKIDKNKANKENNLENHSNLRDLIKRWKNKIGKIREIKIRVVNQLLINRKYLIDRDL